MGSWSVVVMIVVFVRALVVMGLDIGCQVGFLCPALNHFYKNLLLEIFFLLV